MEETHQKELDALNEQIADLRQQRDLWSKRSAEHVEKCNEQYAKLKQVGSGPLCDKIEELSQQLELERAKSQEQKGNAAELRETLEYPKDANDKYIHIGDAVHMLNTNHEGDHEWDDVVLFFEYVGKGGGDDWLVYGEDGAAWACECEVLKQEGGTNGNE